MGCPVISGRSGTKPKWSSNRWKASTSVCHNNSLHPEPLPDENSAETLLQNSSYVFNAGGPVWGLDWCPIHPNDRESRGVSSICSFHL